MLLPASVASLESAPLALIIDLVRSGRATTRPELVTATGLGRKVVTQRVDQAITLGLLEDGELAPSSGGRQARTLRFKSRAGYVYGALVGASEFTAAVLDLDGSIITSHHEDWAVDLGSERTMRRLGAAFAGMARTTGLARPWGIGIGMPGPVEFATGRLVAPPIMPGWDGFSVRSWFRDHYDAPVWVDNDVNLMALGEWTAGKPHDGRDMLFVKAGTGIGAGLINRGRLLRGDRGAAGDIGHVHVSDDPSTRCRCGRVGCLEAVASGWSLLEEATRRVQESPRLSALAGPLALGDIGAAALAGDPLANELVDRRVQALAEVVAHLVNFTNPGVLVLGGGALRTGPRFTELVAESVLARCTDLVTQDLVIRPASLDQMEGVIGAGLLAGGGLLAPASLAHWAESGSPLGHAADLQRLSAELG
ncbi:sugar kinase [Actinoplanes sp. OR16]|uniref:ROK family protein n=1 Tax=Actinoplanes sp. OR16 TaxID=946334 RepID=UPI000F714EA0|nr:ROK family protein [Actinoplanes sp. OR16]BBH69761.1 sugar kinase [Actinoplanes sp. OR16]